MLVASGASTPLHFLWSNRNNVFDRASPKTAWKLMGVMKQVPAANVSKVKLVLVFLVAVLIALHVHLLWLWLVCDCANPTRGGQSQTRTTSLHPGGQQRPDGLSSGGSGASTDRIVIPPRLYVITATYPRPQQLAELTRLAQTLMHVHNLHWLVVEDAARKTSLVTSLLRKTAVSFDHLLAPMPHTYKMWKGAKPRGVSNRNRGLEWIRENATSGVIYFADDDNTYDIEIFEEMRWTRRVSMWPVGLCTHLGVSSPVVSAGKLVGFYDGWPAGRQFPVDMASFAVSVAFLLQRPKARMPYNPGYEEDGFLKSLAPFEPYEIELKANYCSKILVWHTQTKNFRPAAPINLTVYGNTNIVHLKKLIV